MTQRYQRIYERRAPSGQQTMKEIFADQPGRPKPIIDQAPPKAVSAGATATPPAPAPPPAALPHPANPSPRRKRTDSNNTRVR